MGCIYTFLGLFTLAVLYPLIYVISASFSSPTALIRGKVVLLPVDPGLQGYQAIFANSQVWTGYGKSIISVSYTHLDVYKRQEYGGHIRI